MSPREKNKNAGIDLRTFMTDILYNQKEYRGYVESVGNVYCRYETIKPPAYSRNQSPSFHHQFYIVEMDLDESAKKVMLLPRWDPTVSKKDFINSFTTNEWGIKTVSIDGMLFELHQSQDVSVALDAYNDTIDIELPRTTGFKMKNGEVVEYPKCKTARGIAHTYLDTQKKKFSFNHDDVVINKKLTKGTATLLNWGQPVNIAFANTYQPVDTFRDIIWASDLRRYIIGDKITIAISLDVSRFIGVGVSAELTWITTGKDTSWFPYGTYSTTTSANSSLSSQGSIGISLSQGRFIQGEYTKAKDINSDMLSGTSYGVGVSVPTKRGFDVGVDGSYSQNMRNGKVDGEWINVGINASIPLIQDPMSKASFKAVIQETSKAIHLSPQKADEYLNNEYFNK